MRVVRGRSGGGTGVLERTELPVASGAVDATELADMVAEHGHAVLRLAYSYVRDRDIAEDIVQETFLRWLRHRRELDPARTRGWLLSVAANLGRDRLRSWAHRHLTWTDAVPEAATERGPDEDAIALDDARRLTAAVMALPVPYREVVHLRYYEQLEPAEIAELLEIPPATVRTRLLRARRDLRRALTEEDEGV